MSYKSEIGWTDGTWSPLCVRVKPDAVEIAEEKGYTSLIKIVTKTASHVGQHCEPVSTGCKNCYSETWQARCLKVNGTGLPFTRRSRDLIDPFVDFNKLGLPASWKKPRKIFVENQSDLFAEWYSDWMITLVFNEMIACTHHSFQVLTKRVDRMQSFLAEHPHFLSPNIFLGVSVENQCAADERREALNKLADAGWRTFVSYEPALGPVNWKGWEFTDWLIAGGESGPGARPVHPDWLRGARDWCFEYSIPFFFKQWGAWASASQVEGKGRHHQFEDGVTVRRVGKKKGGSVLDGEQWYQFPKGMVA